jgi:GT2 family glycosyltransferase
LLTRTFSGDKKVKLFFSEENLGCPGGRKKALSYAGGDYMVTLDNDIIVTSGWIEDLILRVEEDSDIAGACCKVIFPDNKIQYNGGKAVIINGFVEFSLIDAWKEMNEITTMRRHDCDWIPGGATIYKSRIYEKVSICDEFRNAYEDNDFSFNVRKLGYRLVNCPTARVIHNHVMYDRKSALHEKDYMASRYSHEALKHSVLAFYKRHGLIIKDEYVYRVFGFNGLDENEVRQKFIGLATG